jgi:DNA gyrase/topoisomerase IV subunit B
MVSALSETFELEFFTLKGTSRWRGLGVTLDARSVKAKRGFKLRFKPDRQIFSLAYDFDPLQVRLQELASVFPGLRVRGLDKRTGREFAIEYPRGLATAVSQIAGGRYAAREPLEVRGKWQNVNVVAALQWSARSSAPPHLLAYANTVRTRLPGSHTRGLLRAVEEFAPEKTAGLVAAIDVGGPGTRLKFDGPTKEVLGMPELEQAVYELVASTLKTAFPKGART